MYFLQHFNFQFTEQCQFFPLISSWFNQSFNSYEKLPAPTAIPKVASPRTWTLNNTKQQQRKKKTKTRHFFSYKFRDSLWLNYSTRIRNLKINTNRGRCWSINSHIVVSQQIIKKIISPITQQKAFHNFQLVTTRVKKATTTATNVLRETNQTSSPPTPFLQVQVPIHHWQKHNTKNSKSSKSKTRHYIIEYC